MRKSVIMEKKIENKYLKDKNIVNLEVIVIIYVIQNIVCRENSNSFS